jgi:hypothetical protein
LDILGETFHEAAPGTVCSAWMVASLTGKGADRNRCGGILFLNKVRNACRTEIHGRAGFVTCLFNCRILGMLQKIATVFVQIVILLHSVAMG